MKKTFENHSVTALKTRHDLFMKPLHYCFLYNFRGRFSIVKKCVHKATRKDVAVKFISKKMKKKEQAAHEAALLQHLQHPQYITIHDTYESPTSYILVLEL